MLSTIGKDTQQPVSGWEILSFLHTWDNYRTIQDYAQLDKMSDGGAKFYHNSEKWKGCASVEGSEELSSGWAVGPVLANAKGDEKYK